MTRLDKSINSFLVTVAVSSVLLTGPAFSEHESQRMLEPEGNVLWVIDIVPSKGGDFVDVKFTNEHGEKLLFSSEKNMEGKKRQLIVENGLYLESESFLERGGIVDYIGDLDDPLVDEFKAALASATKGMLATQALQIDEKGTHGLASKSSNPFCTFAGIQLDIAEVTYEFTCEIVGMAPPPICNAIERDIAFFRAYQQFACSLSDDSGNGSGDDDSGGDGSTSGGSGGQTTHGTAGGRPITLIGSTSGSGGGTVDCVTLPDNTYQCTLRMH